MKDNIQQQQQQLNWFLKESKKSRNPLLYPLIAFILTLSLATLLAINLEKNQETRLQSIISNKAHTVAKLVSMLYQNRIASIDHYISDWELLGDRPSADLQKKAQQLLSEIPGFKLVSLIEPPNRIHWAIHTVDGLSEVKIRQIINSTLKKQIRQQLTLLTTSEGLDKKYQGVFIFIPYKNKKFNGLVMIFWNLSYALNEFINSDGDKTRFHISLKVNNQPIFPNQVTSTSDKTPYHSTKTFQLLNKKIQLDIEPTTLWVNENESSMPYIILLSGLMYALLLSYLIFTLEQLRLSAFKDRLMRQFLESEMNKKISAEEELKNLNLTFSLATTTAGIGVWNWNLKSDALYWSEKMYPMYGVPKDLHPSYTTWRNIVLEEDLAPTEKQLKQAIEGLSTFNTIFRIKRANQDIRYIKATGWVQRNTQGEPIQFIGVNTDVTKTIKIEKIMSILQLGLWELDVTSSTMTFNEDFSIKMGYEKDHFAKISLKEWLSFIHEEDRTNYELLLELFTSKKSNFYEHEYRIQNKFNQWVWVNDRGAILSNAHGQEPLCVIGVLSDISVRKKDEENFRFQAEHDTLTNLASRRVAINSLQLSLKRAKRTKEHLALLMIDIDDFKSINDRFGHMAGDAVLKEFAGRLTYYFRESDMISRISGDEFLIILYQADPHVTHGLLNNLGSSLAEPYLLNGEKITVSASIGVVFFPEDDQSPNPLLKKADEALYLAKETGKNKICYWKDHFTNEKKT